MGQCQSGWSGAIRGRFDSARVGDCDFSPDEEARAAAAGLLGAPGRGTPRRRNHVSSPLPSSTAQVRRHATFAEAESSFALWAVVTRREMARARAAMGWRVESELGGRRGSARLGARVFTREVPRHRRLTGLRPSSTAASSAAPRISGRPSARLRPPRSSSRQGPALHPAASIPRPLKRRGGLLPTHGQTGQRRRVGAAKKASPTRSSRTASRTRQPALRALPR